MTDAGWKTELGWIQESGATLGPGLSESEFRRAEEIHGFRFPPDLRSLLAAALPIHHSYPNWRQPESPSLQHWMLGPWEGIAFDIEHNFWWPAWGTRPTVLSEALIVAKAAMAQVPRLIPVYGHRYLPSEPHLAGNPVFSVVQTDIIYYGTDLRNYLAVEHKKIQWKEVDWKAMRQIRFWTEFIDSQADDTRLCWK